MLIKLILELIEDYFGLSPEVALIVSLAVFILFFLLVRELITWYFKMNKLISVQENQTRVLEELLEKLEK
jgi:uncharacterized membrane protein YcjF (UPF0283 family)